MGTNYLSADEMDRLARECFMPTLVRAGQDCRVQGAEQGLSESVKLMRLTTTGALRIVRTARLAAKATGNEMMGLAVGIAGNFRVRQDGRLTAMTVGDVAMHQARNAWEMVTGSNAEIQMIKFSRDLLPPGARDIGDGVPGLRAHSPATNLLVRYLDQLGSSASDLTAVQQADAGHAAIDLLVMALRGPATAAPDGSAPVLLPAMMAYVRAHVHEPLAVERLARLHHISVRHLYSLFESVDMTPGVYIRTQRLLAARNILVDPRHIGLSIGRVAAMTGFANARTFHRAFYQEFGTTPDGWRHDALRLPGKKLTPAS
ncbi:AraC family transcriptional regulator [Actinoplanes sp. TBRC 11911]|uniref:AraC family transcriptional regulator n=1 Tax=Actinoplanes sp. TBRC 11911 TaxID=2729386 RepID=UPI00145F056D|nr:AraC family transcriptional regulator [Actinoplanes sp. TBRC 11911]NMO52918.1 AraC family transcriptional regulator [Actinoplanes sp. TBRC 11911]